MAKKAPLFIIFFSILLVGNGFSQATVEDIFEDETKTVWLGLDFTKFKITGEDVEPEKLKEYFVKWNSLIMKEKSKFDVGDFFDKDDVDYRIDVALKQIDGVDASTRISESYGEVHRLEKSDVMEVASNYKLPESDAPLGILFVMEQFNKGMVEGSMWVTFIDLQSGKILMTDRLTGEPVGIGFRNYWAGSYFEVMEKSEHKMDDWEDMQ